MGIIYTEPFLNTAADCNLDAWPVGGAEWSYNEGSAGLLTVSAANDRVELTTSGARGSARITKLGMPTAGQEINAVCRVIGAANANAGPCVRMSAAGANSFYLLMPLASASQARLYRFNAGVATNLSNAAYTFSTGDYHLRIRADGTGATVTITCWVNGRQVLSYADSDASRLTSGLPGVSLFSDGTAGTIYADDIQVNDLVAPSLEAVYPYTDSNGVVWRAAFSPDNGPMESMLRVLEPTSPAPGQPHRFIYVLPVETGVDVASVFGDGLEELRTLGAHNMYNATLIAPSFAAQPWYGDSDTTATMRYERFMLALVSWVTCTLAVTGTEEHWLCGFSKSGYGAMTLALRNPDTFQKVMAWDFPADLTYTTFPEIATVYGTQANFDGSYKLTQGFVDTYKAPFVSPLRLWISGDTANYKTQVDNWRGRLDLDSVRYLYASGATRAHTWSSGWLAGALTAVQALPVQSREGGTGVMTAAAGPHGGQFAQGGAGVMKKAAGPR